MNTNIHPITPAPSPPAAHTEDAPAYGRQDDDATIERALAILSGRMTAPGQFFSAPIQTRSYLTLRMGGLEHEEFRVLFLDSQHRLLTDAFMFRGTITQTSVYPREIVKEALRHNAAAAILAHNHPSGELSPSRADETLTKTVKEALALVDVRVLDHIIVSATGAVSMAEKGLV